jgi:hypothetical protein
MTDGMSVPVRGALAPDLVQQCFDELDHAALVGRVRERIGDSAWGW